MLDSRKWLLLCVMSAISLFSGVRLAHSQVPPPFPAPTQLGFQISGNTIEIPPGEDFRYSLCLGRALLPNEVSTPCLPSNTSTVAGAGNSPIVFAARRGGLPRGWGIDGNGILHGRINKNFPGRIVEICARQVNADSCSPIFLSRPGLQPPPQFPNNSSSGSGGSGIGGIIGGAAAVTGGVIGGKYLYDTYSKEGGEKDCGPQPSLAFDFPFPGRPSDAQLSAFRSWCQCKGFSGSGQQAGSFSCI